MNGLMITVLFVILCGSALLFTGHAYRVMPSGIVPPAIAYLVTEWEHGFKTSRVIATRYANPKIGYNIGFKFPQNGNDCDRAELSDFMRAHGGWAYQSGGYYGAEMFVKFDGVTDKEGANAKLKELLPELSQVIADLGNGKAVKIALPEPKYKWPDTEPPDKNDPFWELNNNLSVNGRPYKKIEIEAGKWQWQINQQAQEAMHRREYENHKLYQALRSRVVTDEELERAKALGLSLVTQNMVPYYEHEKRRELDDAFVQQTRLRAAAERR